MELYILYCIINYYSVSAGLCMHDLQKTSHDFSGALQPPSFGFRFKLQSIDITSGRGSVSTIATSCFGQQQL